MKKSFLRNDYFLSMLSKFFIMFFGFVSLIFLNRYLGAELKGEYSSLINYVTIISAMLQLGVSSVYPRFKRKKIDNCYYVFISLAVLQSMIYALIVVLFVAVVHPSVNAIFVCIISVIAILTTQLRYINMVENMRRNVFVVFVMSFFNCVITIFAFLLAERNLYVALSIYIAKDLITILLYGIKIKCKRLFKKEYAKYYCSILKEGFFPMLAGLLVILNYKVDIVMLDYFSVDYAAIGIYSLGLSISEYLWVIPEVFKDVVQKRTAKDNAIETIDFSLRCSSTFIILASIILLVLNKQLFILLFGNDFTDSFNITMILLFGVYSMIYYKIIGQLFISDGRSKQYFLILLIGAIANAIINYVTIPLYGIYGAVIASVVSYCGIGLVFLFIYCRCYGARLRNVLFIKKSDLVRVKRLLKKEEKGSRDFYNGIDV